MSRIPLLLSLAFLVGGPAARAALPFEIPIWQGVAPGSEGLTAKETSQERGHGGGHNRALRQIHTPTLTVYLPEKGRGTGVAILIAPGGGYEHLTIDNEGAVIAGRDRLPAGPHRGAASGQRARRVLKGGSDFRGATRGGSPAPRGKAK